MIIVLEGCDGSGKSTLSQRIFDVATIGGLTPEIWHRGVPERHPLEEYTFDIEEGYDAHRTDPSFLLICDRWHHGQEVYGGLYRDSNDLGLGGSWYVDQFLAARGAVQIILAPPDDVLRSRVGERGDGYINPADIGKINDAYRRIAARYPWRLGGPTLRDDAEPLDDEDAERFIIAASESAEEAKALAAFPSYVGPTRPDILLVGDQRNIRKHGRRASRKIHNASFVPYGGTSGQWLCDTIISTDLVTYDIGMTNALEEDVPALIDALTRPGGSIDVVTLGKAAHEQLEQRYVTHGAVPHPQYMRRFQNAHRERYAEMILEAGERHCEVKI